MSERPAESPHERLPEPVALITADSFPLPDRADTFSHPLSDEDRTRLNGLRDFAERQAEAANAALDALTALPASPTAEDWANTYSDLTGWRAGLDAARLGKGISQSRSRITTPITDESPNRDRIGDLGRLRTGSYWSDEAQAWVGGEPTPSSRIVKQAGEWAQARFDAEGVSGDELQNMVRLPDGTVVYGNRIVKGMAAKDIVLKLKEGVAARRLDVSQFETGGEDMIFTVTANATDRATIFRAAMDELASQQPGQCSVETWANVLYLLYQSPMNKKGSDAVIRTFLVTAGTYLFGRAPVLPQDIDLRATTVGQEACIRYVTETAMQ